MRRQPAQTLQNSRSHSKSQHPSLDQQAALAVCESKEQVKGLISSLEAKEIIFCDPVWDGRGEKLIYFFEHEFCKWVAKGGDYTKKEVAQCS